ncbi:unnamed protein product [Clonostachys rosea f. rosea IK726]|uniref:Uncharacterized protein n=1 Tax=Clonostachys rosea f. rosea IK726 TaxID=1349383 RepID=A0ACA9UED4_BIOOC|nr:unnamed protein product [Clonostachys rosea f. rosea IK726]
MAGAGTRGGKRRRAGEDDTLRKAGPAKKKRVALKGRGEDGLRDSASISELAKPYLLAVGRLPLDVLDTTWITGQNRAIDTTHVRELREAFRINGLQRCEPRNRLLCLCNADDVERVRCGDSSERVRGERQNDETDILRWAEVNSGSVEVMAGQHRIAALREFIRDSGSQADEL